MKWHRDGLANGTKYLVMWASSFPTEIRLPSGEVTSLRPYEVGLVDNTRVFHRTPAHKMTVANASKRYFARAEAQPFSYAERRKYPETHPEFLS